MPSAEIKGTDRCTDCTCEGRRVRLSVSSGLGVAQVKSQCVLFVCFVLAETASKCVFLSHTFGDLPWIRTFVYKGVDLGLVS